MPELPEVETVKRGLQLTILNRRISMVTVRNALLRYPVPEKRLATEARGAAFSAIDRRAKYLLLHLSNGTTILAHLGMSGSLLVTSETDELDKHDHIIFSLDSHEQLRYRDPRRFGMIDLIATKEVHNHPRIVRLGVEPDSDQFNVEYAIAGAGKSRRAIKSVLLDSTFVGGLGNIYVNESLFAANIHPAREAYSLKNMEWEKLIQSIRKVLRAAIALGGTTLQDESFRDVLGAGGRFQIQLQVYGREGEKCFRCGAGIERIIQQSRSSYLCENCQV